MLMSVSQNGLIAISELVRNKAGEIWLHTVRYDGYTSEQAENLYLENVKENGLEIVYDLDEDTL